MGVGPAADRGRLFVPGSQQFEFPTLIGEGDTVVLEWRVRARTAGGEAYDNRYCGIFVREGRIREVRDWQPPIWVQVACHGQERRGRGGSAPPC